MSDPQFPQPIAAAPHHPPVHNRAMTWALMGLALFIASVLGLIVLLIFGSEMGAVPLFVGMIVALLPVPIYLSLALWLDRFEAEPPGMLAISFFWGGAVATFLALIFQLPTDAVVTSLAGKSAGTIFGLVGSAPFSEELFKGLALFLLFFWKKDEFDGVVDGVIYATVVALGFATVENFEYYGNAYHQHQLPSTVILRGVLEPFAHPLYTSMTGIGLGVAQQSDKKYVKVIAPIAGLGAAMFLHALDNGTLEAVQVTNNLWIVVLEKLLVIFPVLLGVFLLVIFSLNRESKILRADLQQEMANDAWSSYEMERLCTVSGRMGLSGAALMRGVGTWSACRQYHQTASDLAFYRHRTARGIHPASPAQEEAYLQRLRALRAQLQQKALL